MMTKWRLSALKFVDFKLTVLFIGQRRTAVQIPGPGKLFSTPVSGVSYEPLALTVESAESGFSNTIVLAV